MTGETPIDPAEHLGLVKSVANGFVGRGVEFDDLIGAGSVGLVEASRRFDPGRGTRWSTYAVWYVRGYMLAAIEERRGPIRIPEAILKAHKAGLTPDSPGLTESVRRRLRAAAAILDATFTRDHDLDACTLAAIVPDPRPAEAAADADRLAEKGIRLDGLPALEADIVRRHFGLGGREPESHAEIARSHGIRRDRVQELEARAIDRLRRDAGAERTGGRRRYAVRRAGQRLGRQQQQEVAS